MDDLPFVDERRTLVAAPAAAVWRALARQFADLGRTPAQAYAHLVGTVPRQAEGRMFDQGASVPGFRVAVVEPEQWVRLVGRHRFSRYALVLALDPRPDGTLLRAETYAEFPGLHGSAYRALVISSGGHGVMVDRMLRAIRRRAEAA
ncbi:MAG TPA: hypothetical protein VFR22_00270 [Nocardioidaceae bacterium]|nr:hypothetical protein [Nocardioidaceae bacterium]